MTIFNELTDDQLEQIEHIDSALLDKIADIEAQRIALLGAADVAVKYLEHPDVQVIPFALPASAVAERLREALRPIAPNEVE